MAALLSRTFASMRSFSDPSAGVGWCRGDGAGNDVHSVVVRDFITGDGERLLKHQAVLVVGVAVASKAEVPQTVDNVAPLVFLIALDDVGMRAYHKMRAGIDGAVRKLDLNIVWHVFPFDPPVCIYGYDPGTRFLRFPDVSRHLVFDIDS